nr:7833_t:CDS:2 [Entrophospora candida]
MSSFVPCGTAGQRDTSYRIRDENINVTTFDVLDYNITGEPQAMLETISSSSDILIKDLECTSNEDVDIVAVSSINNDKNSSIDDNEDEDLMPYIYDEWQFDLRK